MNVSEMGMLHWQNIQNDRLLQMRSGSSEAVRGAGDRGSAADDRKLKDVCYDFEAIFIKKMLDSMRKTVPENSLFGKNMGQEIFEDMLYDEYAKKMARTAGLGIADMMYKQLSKNHTPPPANV